MGDWGSEHSEGRAAAATELHSKTNRTVVRQIKTQHEQRKGLQPGLLGPFSQRAARDGSRSRPGSTAAWLWLGEASSPGLSLALAAPQCWIGASSYVTLRIQAESYHHIARKLELPVLISSYVTSAYQVGELAANCRAGLT
jgi:hypothetical protein